MMAKMTLRETALKIRFAMVAKASASDNRLDGDTQCKPWQYTKGDLEGVGNDTRVGHDHAATAQ